MKLVATSGQACVCPIHFLYRMLWSKEMFYRQYFSPLPWHMSQGNSQHTREHWVWMWHIIYRSVFMTSIYWTRTRGFFSGR